MFSARSIVTIALLGLHGIVLAAPHEDKRLRVAPYEDKLLRIEIPAGFKGPASGQKCGLQRGTVVCAFTVAYGRHDPGAIGTVLQITEVDFGPTFPKLGKDRLGDTAEKYLFAFLKGIERRRTDFRASAPSRLELDGLPAARVTWKGLMRKEPMRGVKMVGAMYCVVIGSQVVILHTQYNADAPPETTSAAIHAIESVQFKHGDQ